MYLILFLTVFLLAQGAVFSASLDGASPESYKSYKDHKVFSVTGDRLALVDLVETLNDYDVSLFVFLSILVKIKPIFS